MRAFRDAPIRIKLTLIVVATVGGALLVVGTILTIHDFYSVDAALVNHLIRVADLQGSQCSAALNFERREGAQKVLESLHLEPAVTFACVYDADGNVFAMFRTDVAGDTAPPAPRGDGHAFTTAGDIEVFQQISDDNQPLGTIYVRATRDLALAPVWRRLTARVVVMLSALAIAAFLASRLNRTVSEPILQLAQATRTISAEGGYSLRVPKLANDELGVLCDSFNAMLAQIQKRDEELERHRRDLEKMVEERTQSLEAKTQELARSNAELELFASVASHDLQEPLRMVSSYLELLSQRYYGQFDGRADRWINFAVDGAVRMKQLINDLLEFSRVGTRGKAFEPTDCAKVFARATLNLQRTIEDRGAEVTSGPLPTVSADIGQLTQLLQNLIGNGIKFCKAGAPQVRVEAELQDGCWRFAVRDNGIGIDPQFAERIFVIFQRLHSREEYAGTGIGLAVCKKIVERHGGRIWVESQPGQGAAFFFTIPETKEPNDGDQ